MRVSRRILPKIVKVDSIVVGHHCHLHILFNVLFIQKV
jgi:hypothetical protein